MRIIDADILSYALYDLSPYNARCKPIVLKALRGELELYVTHTTLLETYNVLYWSYRVRPRKQILRKLSVLLRGVTLISPSSRGFNIALSENMPLGDAILVATAVDNRIPIVISNDKHVHRLAEKYNLIIENPLTQQL